MKVRATFRGRVLPFTLAAAVLISTSPMLTSCSRGEDQQAAEQSTQAAPSVATPAPTMAPAPEAAIEPGPPPGGATPEELQDLVSPIALYPDPLVAQILAGSTYPTQVVEADRWLKQNPGLTGDALATQVNQQPWDPSIKSLTQFPSVLQTMNDSLSWTSGLGEAYYNQPTDVMNAIQVMRNRAVAAGTLKSTPQQVIQFQPAPPAENGQPSVQQTVIVQPAQPNTVYVPQYNPTSAYGAPVATPAGYSGSDLLLTGVLSFGAGVLLGSLINNGRNDWNCGWYGGGGSSVKYNNNVYVTNNNNVYPGRGGYPGGGGGYPRPGYGGRPVPYPENRPPHNGGGNGPNRPNEPNRPNFPNRPNNPNRPNGPNPGTLPATRPYDKKTARPYNPNKEKPNFPNNAGGGNRKEGQNRPNQPGQQPGNRPSQQPGNRPNQQPVNRPNQPNSPGGGNRPATQPANPKADPARGFQKDRSSSGGRDGAMGGYEPGGNARANSGRGQASVKGNQNGGGGRGNGGGGGNAKRGGGGGSGRGGGGNKGGRNKK